MAAGLGNEQIAEQLVLSVRTVERHLWSVYAKLRLSGGRCAWRPRPSWPGTSRQRRRAHRLRSRRHRDAEGWGGDPDAVGGLCAYCLATTVQRRGGIARVERNPRSTAATLDVAGSPLTSKARCFARTSRYDVARSDFKPPSTVARHRRPLLQYAGRRGRGAVRSRMDCRSRIRGAVKTCAGASPGGMNRLASMKKSASDPPWAPPAEAGLRGASSMRDEGAGLAVRGRGSRGRQWRLHPRLGQRLDRPQARPRCRQSRLRRGRDRRGRGISGERA